VTHSTRREFLSHPAGRSRGCAVIVEALVSQSVCERPAVAPSESARSGFHATLIRIRATAAHHVTQ
jgi:hypothetical protein